MKRRSLVYLFLFLLAPIHAEKSASQEDLTSFFATQNYKKIENKIQNNPSFSGNETSGTLKAFEDVMYIIAFKNKVLSKDEKSNLFKLLLKKAEGKSEEIIKIVKIGQRYLQLTNRRVVNDAEALGLELAVTLESFPGVKLFASHGIDLKKTNDLSRALLNNKDLVIAKYLSEQGATLYPSLAAGEKYYFESDDVVGLFGLNPTGQSDERIIKRFMDYGLDLNKLGYYILPDKSEKKGTVLDLVYEYKDQIKKSTDPSFTKEMVAELVIKADKTAALLKKYGAKRSAELKK